jgi:hypothetical protein
MQQTFGAEHYLTTVLFNIYSILVSAVSHLLHVLQRNKHSHLPLYSGNSVHYSVRGGSQIIQTACQTACLGSFMHALATFRMLAFILDSGSESWLPLGSALAAGRSFLS